MSSSAAGATTEPAKAQVTGWAGQVAAITGGAQGIGYGIALHLGGLGVRVALLDVNAGKCEEAVAALAAKGIEATSAAIDVASPEQWAAALKGIVERFGRLDVLVQAAGVTGKTGIKTAEVDPQNFDFVMNVNARGIFLGCRAALPYMLERGYGRIVNIASVAGKDGNAGMVAYSASKGAVIAMTKAIGKEYAESGITCNALAPAVVRTAMVEAMPEEQVKYMTGECAKGRGGGARALGTQHQQAVAHKRTQPLATRTHTHSHSPLDRQDPNEAVRHHPGDCLPGGIHRQPRVQLHHRLCV